MSDRTQWLKWAMELQSLAQIGITYTKDRYDLERFERIRNISAEIVSAQSDMPFEKVFDLFCNETGYQTPKIETRAAIFQDDKILLVQESDGLWALPGGWMEVNLTIEENTVKEVKEEAGLDVSTDYIIAIHEWRKRNVKKDVPYGVLKVFVHCTASGGHFMPNLETVASRYFSLDALPTLAMCKNTPEQIAMCFRAHNAPHWTVEYD